MTFEDEHFELLMPFVVVESAGGPYNDEAFVAGWQMGSLDRDLLTMDPRSQSVVIPMYSSCAAQVDLIAMKHGFTVTVLGNLDEQWATFRIERAPEQPT